MILKDERSGSEHQVGPDGVRLGRDPGLEIVFPESEDVVSARHARVLERDGAWWLEDLDSTNGTWLNGVRLAAPAQLATGDRFTLGQRGPALKVSVPGQMAKTQAEPAIALGMPTLRLRRAKGGADLLASGFEIVLGRASSCTIPLRSVADTVVSKRHAVIALDGAGGATLLDLGSRNGTYLNGQPVRQRTPLHVGDRLMLGWHGPVFEVRTLAGQTMAEGEGAPYQPQREPRKSLQGMVAVAEEEAQRATRSRTGVFVSTMARQVLTESSTTFRVITLLLFAGLVAAIVLVNGAASRRTAEAEAKLTAARNEFTQEMRAAAEAQKRAGDEVARLETDLAAARRNAVSRAVVDSLEHRLREAEALSARAPAGPDGAGAAARGFAELARLNGPAVGLVIVRFQNDSIMGSGFAITPSGIFVTNRHVVQDDARGPARQVFVVMAETNQALAADVVVISPVPSQDVALLRIRGYHGPVVRAVDWIGHGAQQGAEAFMLGFPFGTQLAVDQGGYVRSSLFGGYIAAVGETIRFSGSTYAGVSGSPVFNGQGEVIGVHFGAPREGAGLGISVPMSKVRRWLPADVKAELGL